MFEFIKAVSYTVYKFNINAVYYAKPLIFIGAMFREKLVFHHRGMNEADSCLLMRNAEMKLAIRLPINMIISLPHTYFF